MPGVKNKDRNYTKKSINKYRHMKNYRLVGGGDRDKINVYLESKWRKVLRYRPITWTSKDDIMISTAAAKDVLADEPTGDNDLVFKMIDQERSNLGFSYEGINISMDLLRQMMSNQIADKEETLGILERAKKAFLGQKAEAKAEAEAEAEERGEGEEEILALVVLRDTDGGGQTFTHLILKNTGRGKV